MKRKRVICVVSAVMCMAISADISAAAYSAEWYTDAETGKIYYYDNSGEPVTGVQEIDGEVYLFAQNGVLKTGWRTIGGKRRFYDPTTGAPVYGLFEYCGKNYYIDRDNGKLTDEVVHCDNNELYITDNFGAVVSGEGMTQLNDSVYYIGEDGSLATGKITVDGKNYVFNSDGALMYGLCADGGEMYYANENGELISGFVSIGADTYFFRDDLTMSRGATDIDGGKYIFSDEGKMLRGFAEYGGNTYYTDDSGKAMSGMLTLNGKKYFFGEDYTMRRGWLTLGDDKYYMTAEGSAAAGLTDIEGKKYYFSSEGLLQKNCIFDNYNILADGSAIPFSEAQYKAKSIITSMKDPTPKNIYAYARRANYYRHNENTRSLYEIESKGWKYFANYAFDNRGVVCYYLAAMTDILFKQAGYQSRIVYGTGRNTGDHYWNQVCVNGNWTNYDTCNGYEDVTFQYLQTQNYTFYQYVYPTYY